MPRLTPFIVLAGTLAVGACVAVPPAGPSVMALPPQGKSFAQFQHEDAYCRQVGTQQTGGASAAQAASQSGINSAVLGTALGAAAGALLGAAAGGPATGTAIGAGSGLLIGSATGVNAAGYAGSTLQQRYDTGYIQCMVAYGNSVQAPAMTAASGYGYPYPYAYPAYSYGPGWYPGGGFVSFGYSSGWGHHHGHW
jgi:hypothetical protein